MDLEVVRLQPRSRAESAALTALLDLGEMLADSPIGVADTRVIGGHMVALHIARHELDQSYVRMTVDTDCGLDVIKLRQLEPIERFAKNDYKLRDGHRFFRRLGDGETEAVIDVLIPAYTARSGKTKVWAKS